MNSRIFRSAGLVFAVIILCILCSAAAPLIDMPSMRENAAQGTAMLRDEYPVPKMIGGFKSAQLDNYTSVLMVKTAAYTGAESYLHKAFGGMRTDMPAAEGQSDWEAYCTYADGTLSPTQGLSYTRYWHGYTLALRLLLCVLNLANIQMLLYFVQTAMFVCVIVLMNRRGLKAIIPAFFTAYFLMMPFVMGMCLQFMTVSLPMLACCILLLKWDDAIDRMFSMPAFFAALGVLTNYVDLLTFPLVSLGFPLVLLLALRLQSRDSLPHLAVLAVACCVGWGVGFGGMWALKWIITGACFGWARLHSILSQIFLRVSTESNGISFTRMDAVRMNLDVILSKSSYLLILLISGAVSLLPAARRLLLEKHLHTDIRALIMLIPLAAPFAWYIVMANHSVDHAYYTYRSLAVCVFAALSLAACLFEKKPDYAG